MKKTEWVSTTTGFEDSNLTLGKLLETYKLLSPIKVWKEIAEKYNVNVDRGDVLIISTKDQDELIEIGDIPVWVKFSIYIDKGDMVIVHAKDFWSSSL